MSADIAHLEKKIDDKFSQQEKTNDRLIQAIEKLSDAVSKIDVYQNEVNRVDNNNEKLESKIENLEEKVLDIRDSVIKNTEVANEYKWIKKAVIGIVVASVLGGGYIAKTTVSNISNQEKIMSQQAELLKKIADKIDR